MKTIIEPFKIKTVEPIKFTREEERVQILKDAGYNSLLCIKPRYSAISRHVLNQYVSLPRAIVVSYFK